VYFSQNICKKECEINLRERKTPADTQIVEDIMEQRKI